MPASTRTPVRAPEQIDVVFDFTPSTYTFHPLSYGIEAVSYTHLDVYKRQDWELPQSQGKQLLQ